MADFGFNVGVFKVDFTSAEVAAFRARFRGDPLYSGPCLVVERQSGLALDSRQEPVEGSSPVLYPVHGLPWQHWRISPARRGTVRITTGINGLALTAPRSPEDWSPVRMNRVTSGEEQLWRLRPTDDGSAFLIESAVSEHALDATEKPEWLASPHLWSTHWAAWQQWVICRLPMA
ncbi:MAG TPA: RICIN domain-containing protein [Umezawaea sp.]|nr:RICIN domain-containing protein [Umezawaea sp.]